MFLVCLGSLGAGPPIPGRPRLRKRSFQSQVCVLFGRWPHLWDGTPDLGADGVEHGSGQLGSPRK